MYFVDVFIYNNEYNTEIYLKGFREYIKYREENCGKKYRNIFGM